MQFLSTLLTIGTLVGISSVANAQNTGVQFGPKAGLNLSVLDGQINQNANFKPGLLVGAFVRWRPSERIAIQPELVFSQQGATNKANYLGNEATDKVKLNYVNIPVLLKVYLGNVVNIQVGPQVGFVVSGRRVGQYGYYTGGNGGYSSGYLTEDVDVSDSYKSDFALCGGIGFDLPSGLLASVRVNYGLSDINNDSNSIALRQALGIGGVHNRTVEFSLGYALGGK